MKKLLLIALLAGCAAQTNETMDTVLSSWYGSSVDEVIARWGYPDVERNVAGRQLLEWDKSGVVNFGYDTYGYTDGYNVYATTTGGPRAYSCVRQLEVDRGVIVGGDWKGNNCPFNLSLPPYNEWPK